MLTHSTGSPAGSPALGWPRETAGCCGASAELAGGRSIDGEQPQLSRVGSRFGPYQLMRLLGRGGMGEVYEAEDTRKHRVVALKLISGQFSGNPVFRARLQREADAAGRLTEPHVVPIHDYGEIDGQFYVEMRLIDGISLRNVLLRQGPMPRHARLRS
ncbi:kinase domain protein [Mycobacterium xenopi 3993]|nr:kinase domain protein [Mycobacterium xenopi 3993]